MMRGFPVLSHSAATDSFCLATALFTHPTPALFRLNKFMLRRAGASLYSSWVMEINWFSRAERFLALKRLTSFGLIGFPLNFETSLRAFRLRRNKFLAYVWSGVLKHSSSISFFIRSSSGGGAGQFKFLCSLFTELRYSCHTHSYSGSRCQFPFTVGVFALLMLIHSCLGRTGPSPS